jgi:hypothetical protein
MPPHDRVRPHKDHRRAPVPPDATQGDPKQSVACLEVRTRGRTSQRHELLPQGQVFQNQFAMAAQRQCQRAADHDENLKHASIVAGRRRENQRGRVLAKVTSTDSGLPSPSFTRTRMPRCVAFMDVKMSVSEFR